MSGYACPSCGEVSHPFGSGGVEETCAQLGVPFLGRVPLDIAIRTASDAGTPPAAGEGPQADAFMAIARQVSAGSCARSEEHTSELQSLMRISYAVLCLKKKIKN